MIEKEVYDSLKNNRSHRDDVKVCELWEDQIFLLHKVKFENGDGPNNFSRYQGMFKCLSKSLVRWCQSDRDYL